MKGGGERRARDVVLHARIVKQARAARAGYGRQADGRYKVGTVGAM
jgi:hypothetical protein